MFAGKNIIITGGSSGLGKVLAGRLLEQGAQLALIARDPEKLAAARDALAASGPAGCVIDTFACDVTDRTAVEETIEAAAEKTGVPDMLINSAGVLREGYFEHQSIETFREVMDINFYGTLHCIQAVLPHLRKKGGGRIVNICSAAGLMGVFGYSAYCASKYAQRGLSAALRAELKFRNITVHIVYPPEFESPMLDGVNASRTEENRVLAGTIPALSPETVADEIIKGIRKNRYEITPGIVTRVLTGFERVMPGVGRVVSDFKVRRVYKGPDE